MIENKNRNKNEDASIAVAEESREQTWKSKSYMASIFVGDFDIDMAFPYPEQEESDRKIGDEICARVKEWCEEHIDGEEIDYVELSTSKVKSFERKFKCFDRKSFISEADGPEQKGQNSINQLREEQKLDTNQVITILDQDPSSHHDLNRTQLVDINPGHEDTNLHMYMFWYIIYMSALFYICVVLPYGLYFAEADEEKEFVSTCQAV